MSCCRRGGRAAASALSRALAAAAALVVACREAPPAPPERPSITLDADAEGTRVRVLARLPAALRGSLLTAPGVLPEIPARRLLTLHPVEAAPGAQPITGRYVLDGDTLAFTPTFRLDPGRRYVARVAPGTELEARAEHAVPPRAPPPAPVVVASHPVAEVLPANLLKIYVRFSEPMRGGREIFDAVELVDEQTGARVEQAFRDLELWSSDRRELTLLFHPGRVKKGITYARGLAPILVPGRRYVVRLGAELASAQGVPLGRPYEKRFLAGPDDRERLDPGRWRLTRPRVGTREPLHVDAGEPLDVGLLRVGLEVHDDAGSRISGETSTAPDERAWSFTPHAPWRAGRHALEVSAELADLAGNSAVRLFDHPIGDPRLRVPNALRVPFEPTHP